MLRLCPNFLQRYVNMFLKILKQVKAVQWSDSDSLNWTNDEGDTLIVLNVKHFSELGYHFVHVTDASTHHRHAHTYI